MVNHSLKHAARGWGQAARHHSREQAAAPVETVVRSHQCIHKEGLVGCITPSAAQRQFIHYIHICPVLAQIWVKSNLCTRLLALDLTGSHAVAHSYRNARFALKTYKHDSALQKSFFLSRKEWLHILFFVAPLTDLVFVLHFFFVLFLSQGVISAEDSNVTMTQTSLTL